MDGNTTQQMEEPLDFPMLDNSVDLRIIDLHLRESETSPPTPIKPSNEENYVATS